MTVPPTQAGGNSHLPHYTVRRQAGLFYHGSSEVFVLFFKSFPMRQG